MISQRQQDLLEAIIREYLDSSTPVGSSVVVKKYHFNCSAATVRNEMAKLLEEGLLDMMHTSSGRVPTPSAYRLFLEQVMEEEEVPVLQEVALKQRLWPVRYDFNKMLLQATNSLADLTHLLAIATTHDEFVYHAGVVNILDHPEFWDIDTAKSSLYLIEKYELLDKLFQKSAFNSRDVKYLIGDDLGHDKMSNVALVFTPYQVGKNSGYIGVLGPSRMDYEKTIPAVKFVKKLVQDLGESW